MSKGIKHTIEEIRTLFRNEGCEFLDSEYGGVRKSVEYIARCGHKTRTFLQSFLKGEGRICKRCALNNGRKKRGYTLDEVKQVFKDNGCEYISGEYKNVGSLIRYRCQCGHEHEIRFYAFKRGQGRKCPSCMCAKKKTIEEVRDIFSSRGCTLITDEYKWNRQKVDYIAKCGHHHRIKASAFFLGEGTLCPKCQGVENAKATRKYTEEEERELFKKEGCILIEPAPTTNDYAKYIARCGHETSIRLQFFEIGHGRYCKTCSEKSASLGEKLIAKILREKGVRFVEQQSIKTQRRCMLRLDFFLQDRNIAIEFNGRQHYSNNLYFHRDLFSFQDQLERDAAKREYCNEKGIRLVVIDGRKWNQSDYYKGRMETEIRDILINEGIVSR